MNQTLLLKRLALIKQLYKIGLEQSYKNESIAVYSILAFHDSIEMFLKLVAENKGINSAGFNFLEYWNKIPDLTSIELMRNLNARRVNLKHKGLLPAKSEIEASRVNTLDFFEQNTSKQFGLEFSEISLIELVNYAEVKSLLNESQKALDNGVVEDCIEKVAYAFDELLHVYENNKSVWSDSPFFFGKNIKSNFVIRVDDKKLGDFIDNVKESIEELRKAVKITCLGIDYKEYLKFKILTPIVTRFIGGNKLAEVMGKKKWTKENCQFCIDFVVACSLKLQEYDFDVESLEETQFEVKISEG